MSYGSETREEELKNKIAQDFFRNYDHTKIIENVDFCVAMPRSEATIWFYDLGFEQKRKNKGNFFAML